MAKTEKIVYVIWDDSCAGSGWTDRKKEVKTSHVAQCHTVGILLDRTESHTLVSLSIEPALGDVDGTMTIPNSCIRKYKVIGKIETEADA